MRNQKGFTLVELIIVIVILGILAVTAAPKFLDLQGDANASTIQGVAGAADSAASIVYGKSVIAGIQKQTGESITVDTGETINVEYGYPAATAAGIVTALDISVDATGANLADFNVVELAATPGDPGPPVVPATSASVYIYANGTTLPTGSNNDEICAVRYGQATATGTAPNIVYTAAEVTVFANDC